MAGINPSVGTHAFSSATVSHNPNPANTAGSQQWKGNTVTASPNPAPPPPPPIILSAGGGLKTHPNSSPLLQDNEKLSRQTALYQYSSNAYRDVNNYLRGDSYSKTNLTKTLHNNDILKDHQLDDDGNASNEDFNKGMQSYVDKVTHALSEQKQSNHTETYRGLGLNESPEQLKAFTTVGNVVRDPAFVSTSPDKGWAGRDTLMSIKIDPDTNPGRVLTPGVTQKFEGSEGKEMLFPPNTPMEIQHVSTLGKSPSFNERLESLKPNLKIDKPEDADKIERIIVASVKA